MPTSRRNTTSGDDAEFHRHDTERVKEMYSYLLGTLARANDLGRSKVNERFGGGRSFYDRLRSGQGAITTGELVERLSTFQNFCQQELQKQNCEDGLPPVLTEYDIRRALLKLIELTPEERDSLGLTYSDEDILLQEAFLHLWSKQSHTSYQQVLNFYQTSIGSIDVAGEALNDYSDAALNESIQQMVRSYLSFLKSSEPAADSSQTPVAKIIRETGFVDLVIHEVNQIVLKVGIEQIRLAGVRTKNSYCTRYLPKSFVTRLVRAVVDNQILTSEFPVYIKSITVEKHGPFPLTVSHPKGNEDAQEPNTTSNSPNEASLNRRLLDLHQYEIDFNPYSEEENDYEPLGCEELASQHTHRVEVEFEVQLSRSKIEKYKQPKLFQQLGITSSDEIGYVRFTLVNTGIGGVLSHITKLINNAVLSDICVNSSVDGAEESEGSDSTRNTKSSRLNVNFRELYFPIAHDVLLNHHFPRSNIASPMWAHSLVRLCRNTDLAKAMSMSQKRGQIVPYASASFGDKVGVGDYCGFDLLLCAAKASLNARLRAISQTGIASEDYLVALCERVQGQNVLKRSNAYVSSYPFSSLAQESLLNQELLSKYQKAAGADSYRIGSDESHVPHTACLRIAESFLVEGAYRKAWRYLQKVSDALARNTRWYDCFGKKGEQVEPFRVISGSLVVRYSLCFAYYLLTFDAESEFGNTFESSTGAYLPSVIEWNRRDDSVIWGQSISEFRKNLIRRSWEALEAAEKHLYIRLAKYFVINEESQGTFHPHYKFLSQIYFLRAKAFLYFPNFVPLDSDFCRVPTDLGANSRTNPTRNRKVICSSLLYLFEKARLYAATDGDSQRYASYTAYQSWVYVMSSYFRKLPVMLRGGALHVEFTSEECLQWARRMRNDALISYEDIGRKCYLKIKEKSGVSETLLRQRNQDRAEFGAYRIDAIPPIKEIFKEGGSRVDGVGDTKILELDMSLLAISKEDLQTPSKSNESGVIYLFGPIACYLFFARGMYHLTSPYIREFERPRLDPSSMRKVQTAQEWEIKLRECKSLFNYAWAIADDGGEVESVVVDDSEEEEGYSYLKIARPFESPYPGCANEVTALRDLYPYRITEIACLGRVFSAASIAMLLVLQQNSVVKERLFTELHGLLDTLHQEDACAMLDRFQGVDSNLSLLDGQRRYNGSISSQLAECRRIILQQIEALQATQQNDEVSIESIRNNFVPKLFSAIHGGVEE